MTTIEERAPLGMLLTLTERDEIAELLARVERMALDLSATLGAALEVVREAPSVTLGEPTRTVVTTMAVAEVPVDGSVEVRGVTFAGRYGPWGHVIGEQAAVGGEGNRSLLIDGLSEPWTWHGDQYCQVRPYRDARPWRDADTVLAAQELRWENPR